jgi:hypothetical protein
MVKMTSTTQAAWEYINELAQTVTVVHQDCTPDAEATAEVRRGCGTSPTSATMGCGGGWSASGGKHKGNPRPDGVAAGGSLMWIPARCPNLEDWHVSARFDADRDAPDWLVRMKSLK